MICIYIIYINRKIVETGQTEIHVLPSPLTKSSSSASFFFFWVEKNNNKHTNLQKRDQRRGIRSKYHLRKGGGLWRWQRVRVGMETRSRTKRGNSQPDFPTCKTGFTQWKLWCSYIYTHDYMQIYIYISRWICLYIYIYTRISNTPWKINMKPTYHPFRKENDLPNLHDYSMIMFHVYLQGCI